jgi:DNA ligase-1
VFGLPASLAGLFGAYLLAIYDPDSENYQTISKLGTGFSEEKLVVRTHIHNKIHTHTHAHTTHTYT